MLCNLKALAPAVVLAFLGACPGAAEALFKSDVKEKTLSNGLRILFVRVKDSPVMECRIYYRLGSAADPSGREGISALVASATFSGTRRIGTLDFKAEEEVLTQVGDFEEIAAQEKIPREFVERLKAIPLRIRKIEDSVKTTLARLAESPRTPMTEEEMKSLRAFVGSEEKNKEALQAELEVLKASPEFLKLETRNSIEARIRELKQRHMEMLVPGDLAMRYLRAGGCSLPLRVDRDYVGFGASLPANRFELFLWIESDRMREAIFRGFHDLKHSLAEEAVIPPSSPTLRYLRELESVALMNHPAGRPVSGWPATVESVTPEEARRHYTARFSPANAVIVFAGDTEPVNLFAKASAYFEFPPPAAEATEAPAAEGDSQCGTRRLECRAAATPRIDLLYRAPALKHEHSAAVELGAECLRCRSSRLGQELLDPGLARSFEVEYLPGASTGIFRITVWPSPKSDAAAVEGALRKALQNVVLWGFTSEAVAGAAGRIIARWGIRAQAPALLADALAESEARGGWGAFFDRMTSVSVVDADGLKEILGIYLRPEMLTVGVLSGKEK